MMKRNPINKNFWKTKWTVFILIIFIWLITATGLSIIVYKQTLEANKIIETLKTFLLCLGGLGIVLPTFLNAFQSVENYKLLKEKIEFDKVENSFKLLEKWDDSNILEARKFTRRIAKTRPDISDNELIDSIEKNEELKQSVILLFNYWDLIRVSVLENRVKEELLKELFAETYCGMYERFKPWLNLQWEYEKDFREFYNRWKP